MKIARLALPVLCLLAACGGGAIGYLNTDVLEPAGLGNPTADGVKLQGKMFQEGTLTYGGKGDVRQVFVDYMEAMSALEWARETATEDPAKGSANARLRKDARVLTLDVTTGADPGTIKVVIKVTRN